MNTVLFYDGSTVEPRLHRAIFASGIRIIQIADCANTETKQNRVIELGTRLGCELSDQIKNKDNLKTFFIEKFPKFNANKIILTLSESEQNDLKHIDVLTLALSCPDVRVCLPQPCPGFNTLPIEDVIKLYAIAEKNRSTLLASTRFNFSTSMYHIKNLIRNSPEFGGGISDILVRTGWGVSTTENSRRHQLMSIAAHAFHVVFCIASISVDGLPETVTVLEDHQPNLKPPVFSISLKWKNGIIASIFLTANRTWGSNYHHLEVSGKAGAYITSDLIKWEIVFHGAERIVPVINDDEQQINLDGSAPKLRILQALDDDSSEDDDSIQTLSNERNVVLHSLWLRDLVEWLLARPRHSTNIHNYRRSLGSIRSTTGYESVCLAARRGEFAKAIKIAKEELEKEGSTTC